MSERTHLADHLGPVSAPAELWSRLSRPAPKQPQRLVPAWAAACVCFLVGGAAMLSGGFTPAKASLESALMSAEPDSLELRAADSDRLAGWLAAQGIFDQRVGAGARKIRFLGARRIETPRGPAAVLFYRHGSRTVKLALTMDGSADPAAKRILSRTLTSGERLFDWHANGQHYLMLTSRTEAAETACQVCHG